MSSELTHWFCRCLSAAAPGKSAVPAPFPRSADETMALLQEHGIQYLLCRALRGTAEWDALPDTLRAWLTAEWRNAIALDILRQEELRRVLDAFAEQNIFPVVMKGGALAHTHYADPSLRPRVDTDLLLGQAPDERVGSVLVGLGYELSGDRGEHWVNRQFNAWRRDRHGVTHTLDLHRAISNRALFARALGYQEVAARAVPLPALGGQARALHPVDALLLACMHRVAHTDPRERDRLIWLYDIHLLYRGLSAQQADRFAALAREKGVAAVCLDGLHKAREYFETTICDRMLQQLSTAARSDRSRRLLQAGPASVDWVNLGSIEGLANKWRFLHELVLPPAHYMRRKYPHAARYALPFLYLRRAATGALHRARGMYRTRKP